VEEAVAFGEIDGGAEEVGEGGGGEEVLLGAVGGDATALHEEEAIDLGNDVGGVVGDEEDRGSPPGELAEEIAKLSLGGEVEGVGGLIEQKHFAWRKWVRRGRIRGGLELGRGPRSGEGPGNQDAALLAGGHFADELMAEAGGADLVEEVFGAGAHAGGDGEVGPKGGGGEEAGEDRVQARGMEEGFAGQVGGDDAKALAEFGEIPAGTAKKVDGGAGEGERVEFAGNGLEQGGLAAAVGTKDGKVLSRVEGEMDVVENGDAATGDVNVMERKNGLGHASDTG